MGRKNGSENMTAVKNLIQAAQAEDEKFIRIQNSYKRELEKIRTMQSNGETVDVSKIQKSLIKSGVLDSNGKLSELYSKGHKPTGDNK